MHEVFRSSLPLRLIMNAISVHHMLHCEPFYRLDEYTHLNQLIPVTSLEYYIQKPKLKVSCYVFIDKFLLFSYFFPILTKTQNRKTSKYSIQKLTISYCCFVYISSLFCAQLTTCVFILFHIICQSQSILVLPLLVLK